jgi:hypothetical protein
MALSFMFYIHFLLLASLTPKLMESLDNSFILIQQIFLNYLIDQVLW